MIQRLDIGKTFSFIEMRVEIELMLCPIELVDPVSETVSQDYVVM